MIKIMPDQPGDVPYTCANVRKASCLLGYEAKVPFGEGIRRTVEWYKHAFEKYMLEICPERQANGLSRSASLVKIQSTQ